MEKFFTVLVFVFLSFSLVGCGVTDDDIKSEMTYLLEASSVYCKLESDCEDGDVNYKFFASYIAEDKIDSYKKYDLVKVYILNREPVKVTVDFGTESYSYSEDHFVSSVKAQEKLTVEQNAVTISAAASVYCVLNADLVQESNNLELIELSEYIEGMEYFDFYKSVEIYLNESEFDYVVIKVTEERVLTYNGENFVWNE